MKTPTVVTTRIVLTLSALAMAAVLSACGGTGKKSRGNDSPSEETPVIDTTTAFPTGVAVASPTALSDSSSLVAAQTLSVPWSTRLADWGSSVWQALETGDTARLGRLASALLPMAQAWAAPTKVPEGAVIASKIEAVAAGTLTLAGAGLNLNDLFNTQVNNAQCFGPTVAYEEHDDGPSGSNGVLPSGDLGMWTEFEGNTSEPCATAQIDARLQGVKEQYQQGMLLMAALRRIIGTTTGLGLPDAGVTLNATTAFSSAISTAAPGVTLDSATVSLDDTGAIYTYRMVVQKGSGDTLQRAEIVIRHQPTATDTVFSGILQITASQLSSDMAFGCSDEMDGSLYRVATATTVRYDRDGSALDFSARSANYCGHPTSDNDYLGGIATVDVNGELDLSVSLEGGSTRNAVNGWRGNASRFAGSLDTDTQTGNFLYVWQAGNLDDFGRAFAVQSSYNSSDESRTLDAYYAYTDAIAATDGSLLGMICNWAGPGNQHQPVDLFQSQSVRLGGSASAWAVSGTSHIAYAPTVSCDASATMRFDVNADSTLETGEGSSFTHALDTLSTAADVPGELAVRGYVQPSLF